MANWKNIQKLYDYLGEIPKSKFDMGSWFSIKKISSRLQKKYHIPGEGTALPLSVVRKNGPVCRTAGCLAGSAVVLLGKVNERINWITVEDRGRALLGLTNIEQYHMFQGKWSPKVYAQDENNPNYNYDALENITKTEARKYLKKVLAEKNVMVTL